MQQNNQIWGVKQQRKQHAFKGQHIVLILLGQQKKEELHEYNE